MEQGLGEEDGREEEREREKKRQRCININFKNKLFLWKLSIFKQN